MDTMRIASVGPVAYHGPVPGPEGTYSSTVCFIRFVVMGGTVAGSWGRYSQLCATGTLTTLLLRIETGLLHVPLCSEVSCLGTSLGRGHGLHGPPLRLGLLHST